MEIPISGISPLILYLRMHATRLGYSLQHIEKDTQHTQEDFYVITELNITAPRLTGAGLLSNRLGDV